MHLLFNCALFFLFPVWDMIMMRHESVTVDRIVCNLWMAFITSNCSVRLWAVCRHNEDDVVWYKFLHPWVYYAIYKSLYAVFMSVHFHHNTILVRWASDLSRSFLPHPAMHPSKAGKSDRLLPNSRPKSLSSSQPKNLFTPSWHFTITSHSPTQNFI